MAAMADLQSSVVWDEQRLAAPHAQADKSRRVRWMFDSIAPTYELINTLASMGRDRAWRRKMLRLARVRPDDVMLDIACGTGDVARTFAAAAVRPARIIGADFSLPMVSRAAARPIDGAAFCQGDALRLPLADASVSIVTCAFGIRNFQDLGAGLREMHRVLRPGGRALVLEFSIPRAPLLRQLYFVYFRKVLSALATWVSGDRTGAYRYLPHSVLSFQGREEIISLLASAGFEDVSGHAMTLGIVTVYVASRR
jgi:demethylmenaquinone methyltransferase/2-methoxy-6-polyprenyl-1,4-benzoquinol methylase